MEKGTLRCCCLNQTLPLEWEKLETLGQRLRESPPALPTWKPLEAVVEREQGLKNAATKGDPSPV